VLERLLFLLTNVQDKLLEEVPVVEDLPVLGALKLVDSHFHLLPPTLTVGQGGIGDCAIARTATRLSCYLLNEFLLRLTGLKSIALIKKKRVRIQKKESLSAYVFDFMVGYLQVVLGIDLIGNRLAGSLVEIEFLGVQIDTYRKDS